MSDENDVLSDEEQAQINAEVEAEWDRNSEPKPSMFSDYDNYVVALTEFKTRQAFADAKVSFPEAGAIGAAVRDGVAAAITPQPNPSIPDDPHKHDRARADAWVKDCRARAEMERVLGHPEKAQDWEERALWGVKDLEKLPPPPEVVISESYKNDAFERGASRLFDPKEKDSQIWDHPRMVHDAPIAIVEANARAKKIIRLPLTDDPGGRGGNPLPCKPENMVSVELPPNQLDRFKQYVYAVGNATDPDTVIRRSWNWLSTSGYGSLAKRAHEPKEKRHGETEVDPSRMSFKEFCAWREKTENEKLGGPRQGFVFPKKR